MSEQRLTQSIPYRTACDPCSRAKVRCDKKHPACDRCIQTKLSCSYSQSRKHGRRSWRQRATYTRMKNQTGISAEMGGGDGRVMIPSVSADMAGGGRLLPRPSAPSMPGPGLDCLLGYGQQQHLQLDETSSLMPLWSFEGDCHPSIDIGSYANIPMTEISPQSLEAETFPVPSLTQSQTASQEPSLSSSSFSPSPSSSPSQSGTTTTTTTTPTEATTSTHDCEAEAIAILRSMQHNTMQAGATSCATNPAQPQQQQQQQQNGALNLRPGFDRVLSTNAAALDGCVRLMRCSCALCPHIILLHVSILSKMLFWYRIAAATEEEEKEDEEGGERKDVEAKSGDGGDNNTNNNNSSSSNSDSNKSSTSLSPDAPSSPAPSPKQFSVLPTSIEIGTLRLDAAEQAELRRALLLRELRRTEAVVDGLVSVDRTALDEGSDELVRSSVEWSLGGIERVREELRGLVAKIRRGRRAEMV